MGLYIHGQSANSIFRLIGKNENALTHALGYAFHVDTNFLIQVLKSIGILKPIKGKNYLNILNNKDIFLQQYNSDNSGIKDILIECGRMRIVIEAKTDNSFPRDSQLLKYIDSKKNMDWSKFSEKFIVVLSRRTIKPENYSSISKSMSVNGIELIFVCWTDIHNLIRQYIFIKPITIGDFILHELAQFIEKDYEVKAIEKEVIYRKVLKEYYTDICNKEGDGFYFDGAKSRKAFIYPSSQFFLACYGPSRSSKKTGEYLRRIKSYFMTTFSELISCADPEMYQAFESHLKLFPIDRDTNNPIHVFRLGVKIPVHENKKYFDGSELGYGDIDSYLTPNES